MWGGKRGVEGARDRSGFYNHIHGASFCTLTSVEICKYFPQISQTTRFAGKPHDLQIQGFLFHSSEKIVWSTVVDSPCSMWAARSSASSNMLASPSLRSVGARGETCGRLVMGALQMSQMLSPLTRVHLMAQPLCLNASSPRHWHSSAIASPDCSTQSL